jgi:hypothetical protein
MSIGQKIIMSQLGAFEKLGIFSSVCCPRITHSIEAQLAQYKSKSIYTYIINNVPKVVDPKSTQFIP